MKILYFIARNKHTLRLTLWQEIKTISRIVGQIIIIVVIVFKLRFAIIARLVKEHFCLIIIKIVLKIINTSLCIVKIFDGKTMNIYFLHIGHTKIINS